MRPAVQRKELMVMRERRPMSRSTKAGVFAACIVVGFCGSLAWRARREKIAEWNKLSAVAAETRAHAEQGDAAAQNELGKLYLDGRGVSKDYAEALRWFDKSADQNDTHAESALG
jgi:TPR repeat protein